MIYPDDIKTITKVKEHKLKAKKSVLIAQIYPIQTQRNSEEIIKSVKKKYYDASHHCYAFKLADGTDKSSDAGEPSGTAGARIYNAIEHFEINNVLVIVIRYFGGVKLGTGPLGKAYYSAAFGVIQKCEIIIRKLYQTIQITSDFENLNLVHKILSTYESRIENSEYKKLVELKCLVVPKNSDKIKLELTNRSSGKVNYKPFSEYFYL
jgi:uncharacterized YigZ family protein